MAYLDNFTEKTNTDNRFASIFIDKEDEIVIGGTCTHIFILPFKYSEYVQSSQVFYRQGLTVVLEKFPSSYTIEEDATKCSSKITVKLSPEETRLFQYNALDTFVQMKIFTVNNEVLYNKPNKLIIRQPLDAHRIIGE